MKVVMRTMVIFISLLMAGPLVDTVLEKPVFTSEAEAKVGRPLTPLSVAGVARRTTRRTIRRQAAYVAVLPRGCTTVIIEGMRLHKCGATYYQPQGNRFVVVIID